MLAQLVQVLPEPAFLLSPTGEILFANSAAAGFFDTLRTRLAGSRLPAAAPQDRERLDAYLRLCARSRQLVPGGFSWQVADRMVDVRCDGALVVAGDEAAPAIVFLRFRPRADSTAQFTLLNRKIADLTREIIERKKAEQHRDELLAAERAARFDAEQASRIKDEFLATLSHELRTPLNAIIGWAHLLLRGLPADQARSAVETIERNARAQARIIEDLLDMSRIVSGNVRLDVQRIALAPVIEGAVESIRPAADAKGIRLQVQLDPLAPPVTGDPARLQQVVWNLLSNAVKFTDRGGKVQVAVERASSHVEITVSDTGEGIRPDVLPRVFDRFSQADSSTTRRHHGLGLGLAIVKHLIELHGGTVHARSPGEGQGATFVVMLPVSPGHEPERTPSADPAHPAVVAAVERADDGVRLDGTEVLVVDDEQDARDLMRHLLGMRGARVTTAPSALDALAALDRGRFGIVLCDIGMPHMDGYAFAQALRSRTAERGGRTPAIALTAFARQTDRMRAIESGFDAHLAKPIEPAELLLTIAGLLDPTK